MDLSQKSFHTTEKVEFEDLLGILNKKIQNPDLHFSEFEVAEVIHHLNEVEKVIYLSWRQY